MRSKEKQEKQRDRWRELGLDDSSSEDIEAEDLLSSPAAKDGPTRSKAEFEASDAKFERASPISRSPLM